MNKRSGQIVPWLLSGLGTLIGLAGFVYSSTASSYKDSISQVSNSVNQVALRQNDFDKAILQLTSIESQNATLLKVYGEQIKALQIKK